LHSEDGYDEISLTGPFSYISNKGAGTLGPREILQTEPLKAEDLNGGKTVKEAADIFMNVLQGKGTEAQHKVVIANSAIGLRTVYPDKKLEDCITEAENSLYGQKALDSFRKLVG
ncbi:MAG: anthranilate phosphoribosyltransferase, partial [Mangrovibacterium sp.]